MKKTMIMVVALALTLMTVSSASASYYMTKGEARSATRHIMQDLGYAPTRAGLCRPKGLARARTGYDYHKWVCAGIGWTSNEDGEDATTDNWDCIVRMWITGHTGQYDYSYRSTGSTGTCTYGAW